MRSVNFGRTGVKVSAVLLGCGNFGGVGSAPAFFGQGETEEEAFAPRARDQLLLSSKVFNPVGDGPNDWGLSRRHIFRQIDDYFTLDRV